MDSPSTVGQSGAQREENLDLAEGARSSDSSPASASFASTPAYHSPLRHHRRTSSRNKQVKETVNAKSHYGGSSDDGASIHRINQYVIKQEIGRGSFGSVHLAADQHGTEYAIKEFSKSRLRKRIQSDLLRRPSRRKKGRRMDSNDGFVSPTHHQDASGDHDPFELIKGEIAVMKKLNHPNIVRLIEVLDDPEEDSLYMVLEMCKKGVVMKVGLEETADPYDDDTCRYWFRDMVLGLEYLHAQGIIHRDLKPDNCLITHDDVLKIVDFGVSEMFDKESDMNTSKSAGSPAFMPPELCVARHGHVSGRAIDVWSMGVTLYCLRYGRIPFERTGMLDLYEAIKSDAPSLEAEQDESFRDLILRMLEKDPRQRIQVRDIRVHPWVTKGGKDPLLSEDENISTIVDDPTEEEMDAAITGNMGRLLAVAKAVKRFKKLLPRHRHEINRSILGRASPLTASPGAVGHEFGTVHTKGLRTHDRRPLETATATEGYDQRPGMPRAGCGTTKHVEAATAPEVPRIPSLGKSSSDPQKMEAGDLPPEFRPSLDKARTFPLIEDHGRGHAHDPLEDVLFLNVGAGPNAESHTSDDGLQQVCESPPGVEENIYEKAYGEEMERILARRGRSATMYLTRRVEHKQSFRDKIGDYTTLAAAGGAALADLSAKMHESGRSGMADLQARVADSGIADLQARMFESGRSNFADLSSKLYEGGRSGLAGFSSKVSERALPDLAAVAAPPGKPASAAEGQDLTTPAGPGAKGGQRTLEDLSAKVSEGSKTAFAAVVDRAKLASGIGFGGGRDASGRAGQGKDGADAGR